MCSPLLRHCDTFLFSVDDQVVATVTIGTYPDRPDVGGIARVAVRRRWQGTGLGRHAVLFGYRQLRERGLMLGESIVTLKRRASLRLHFACGFEPLYDFAQASHHLVRQHDTAPLRRRSIRLALACAYQRQRRQYGR